MSLALGCGVLPELIQLLLSTAHLPVLFLHRAHYPIAAGNSVYMLRLLCIILAVASIYKLLELLSPCVLSAGLAAPALNG